MEDGWSRGDWLALAGLAVGILAIVLGLFAAHFHSVVRDEAARARLIERLTAKRGRDLYHDYLHGALGWLDRTIDPPPLARGNPRGRPVLGMKSLGICISLSLAYSFTSFLAGWIAGSQGVFGQVTFLEDPYWAPAGWPPWLLRLIVALMLVGTMAIYATFFSWLYPKLLRRLGRPDEDWVLPIRRLFAFLGFSCAFIGAVAGAVALRWAVAGIVSVGIGGDAGAAVAGAGAVAMAGAGVLAAILAGLVGTEAFVFTTAGAVGGVLAVAAALPSIYPEQTLIALLFLVALPLLNGLLDWISLNVSRWLGHGIVAERDSPARLTATLSLAVLDLILAVIFAFVVAWLLAFGIEASARVFQLSLGLDAYVREAAAAPWTTGFWATFMVVSTLIPTAVHLVLAMGAVLVAWPSNPLRRLAAARLASGNEADWLLPQVYLTFGWLVPTFGVPFLLIAGLAVAFDLIWLESLPESLRDTALHAIDSARRVW